MLHIDKNTKKSYYTYLSKPILPVENAIPSPIKKSKKIHKDIEEITQTLEDCVLSISCPVTMSVAYNLNIKLFRKMISEAC